MGKTHKEVAAATAGKVAAAMQSAGHDRAQFERELMRQGIGVVFRQNETGRIYGATFIDHAAKAVFNGSRLGKEFSAGVFNDLFAGQEGIHLPQPSAGWNIPSGSRSIRRLPMGRTRYRLSSRPQGRHHPKRGGRLQPLCPRTRRSVRRPARTAPKKEEKNDDTVVSNKEQKDSINQATIRMAYRPHFRSVKRTTGV